MGRELPMPDPKIYEIESEKVREPSKAFNPDSGLPCYDLASTLVGLPIESGKMGTAWETHKKRLLREGVRCAATREDKSAFSIQPKFEKMPTLRKGGPGWLRKPLLAASSQWRPAGTEVPFIGKPVGPPEKSGRDPAQAWPQWPPYQPRRTNPLLEPSSRSVTPQSSARGSSARSASMPAGGDPGPQASAREHEHERSQGSQASGSQ